MTKKILEFIKDRDIMILLFLVAAVLGSALMPTVHVLTGDPSGRKFVEYIPYEPHPDAYRRTESNEGWPE